MHFVELSKSLFCIVFDLLSSAAVTEWQSHPKCRFGCENCSLGCG